MGAPGHSEIDSIKEHERAPKLKKKEMVRKYVNGKGQHRFTGGSDLKSSQAYPLQFSIFCLVQFFVLFSFGVLELDFRCSYVN